MRGLDLPYKACIIKDIGHLEIVDKRLRALQPNEVVVKVDSCGICGSDIHRVYIKGPFAPYIVPGHEFSGTVVKTQSSDIHMLNKRIVVNPLIPCGVCRFCKLEKYNLCDNYIYLGVRGDGGFAGYAIVPINNLIPIPDSLSYEEAALVEPFSVVLRGIKKIPNISHAHVLILGLGTIGLLAGMVAKRFGADLVVGIDRNNYKQEIAKKIGFSDSSSTDSTLTCHPFSVLIDCSGSSELLNQNIPRIEKEGTILLLATYRNNLSLSPEVMSVIIRSEVRIFSSWSSNSSNTDDDWATCVHHLALHEFDFKPLITHIYPLHRIGEAFDAIHEKKIPAVKVIIKPD